MNRLLIIAAIAASVSFSQDHKADSAKNTPVAAPTERALTETEVLKLRLVTTRMQLVQEKYKAPMERELEPLIAEQNELATAACRSLGIPPELVQSQCRMNTGIGPDGKPATDSTGKVVPAKVWWERPTATPGTK